jgi:hypothetical protein
MQKNKNRQGLALGAVFAMVASLFVMTSPAQAADETSVVIFPTTGLSTQTTMLADEGFDLSLRFGTGVGTSYRSTATATPASLFGILVDKPAGIGVSAAFSGAGAGSAGATIRSATNPITGTSVSTAVETAGTRATFASMTSGSPVVKLSMVGASSVSASVAVTVTPYLDINSDGDFDSGEPLGTPVVVTFVPWSALGATVSLEQTVVGDSGSTVSFAVTSNAAINWTQLDNTILISASHLVGPTSTTNSAAISMTALAGTAGFVSGLTTAGAYSASYSVGTKAYAATNTTSASVWYGVQILAQSGVVTATSRTVSAVTVSPITGVNVVQTADGTADARMNSAFAVTAYPYSASITTSVAVASAFTVSQVSNIEFGAQSGVILNGTTYTSSAAFLAAGFTIAAGGGASIPVSTYGQTGTGTIGFSLTSQIKTDELVITVKGTVQTVAYTPTAVAGLAGAAKSFSVTALDQWGVASVRTDQRIAASVVLGTSTSLTVSAAVVNGAATVTLAPTPDTRTGSGTVTFTLQTLDQSTQVWADTGTADTATWNVYSYAAGTDGITSRTVTASASISYGVNLSWSSVVAVVVTNSFSDVVVSAPGLMIQNSDETSSTASDALTVAANGQTANFKFTSRLAGTYTVTFTSGAASTTSTITVHAAAGSAGSTLTFDKTSIAAGETTTITGTLLDVNGNPVATSDGAAIVSVAWTGKALPFGNSTAMETDAAGQLTFQVLVLSTEVGDAAISATYKPAGLAVSALNITVVQAVAVGKAAATAAADQKVNVGSFKGFVALYAKGYAGQKMTAIVAGKWIKVDALASGFERVVRYTGAGYTITTKIYIDGVLKGTFSTLTK